MVHQSRLLIQIMFTGALVSLICGLPTIAQQLKQGRNLILNQAQVYYFQNNVTFLRGNTSRPVRLRDRIEQRDRVRTASASTADLLFNDRTLARVDQGTTFTFRVGLRRHRLPEAGARPRAVDETISVMDETIFELKSGAVLIASPPGSVGTQVETPEARINVAASELALDPSSFSPTVSRPQSATQTSNPLPALQRTSAVMVVHGADTTQIFALTDGDVTVSQPWGGNGVPLLGGQTVAVSRGQFGEVQEFALESFYRSPRGSRLANGLGSGQENEAAQEDEVAQEESETVQQTLAAVRVRTLAAVRQQIPRLFVERALGGGVIDFYQQRDILRQTVVEGVYERTGGRTFQFIPNDGTRSIPIQIDPDERTIQIDGQSGIDNSAGLSGNNASGTIILRDGRAIRGEIFDIDGEFEIGPPEVPPIDTRSRGRLTTTIDRAPDR
jgi:hypothetical protein